MAPTSLPRRIKTQVGQELRKMTAFIKQEAMEKAREIEIKANEEFAIEKSKLVRQETDAMDSAYEKKFKQATMSQQITRSTVANKTRLKVLAARQEMLDSIFDQAQKKLAEGAGDKAKYRDVLKNLLLEGFYALHEPVLQVRARKADHDVVRSAIDDAAKEYKTALGTDIKASIDESNPVPEGRLVAALPSFAVILHFVFCSLIIPHSYSNPLTLQQRRRRHDPRRRRQDRDRQHVRGAPVHPQHQRPASHEAGPVRREPEPEVLRLSGVKDSLDAL